MQSHYPRPEEQELLKRAKRGMQVSLPDSEHPLCIFFAAVLSLHHILRPLHPSACHFSQAGERILLYRLMPKLNERISEVNIVIVFSKDLEVSVCLTLSSVNSG